MGYLRFAAGEDRPEADLRAAFERDPSLAGDAGWLADWLWSRPLDELLPDGGPEFADWFYGSVRPLLEPRSARSMRRDVAATRAEALAIRLARSGRPVRASSAALTAATFRPGRVRDRRLAGVLLDSIVGTSAGRVLRGAKRRLLGQARAVVT
jgi:hypothetical protein